MKIEFNFWFFLTLTVLIVGTVQLTIAMTKFSEIQNDFNLKQLQLTQSNVKFYYSCDTANFGYQAGFYNCANQYKNLTGYYCNGTLICENEYIILEGERK